MSKMAIRLPKGEWEFDDSAPLGKPGGFGEVFRGVGPDGPVAVKRLKISAADSAHRELDISRRLMARNLQHVVPVLDAGQDANSDRYFLVMPVCERSLQDAINSSQDGLGLAAGADAIASIISGLIEVSDLTHRDLKPSNVLLHEARWKIADFGIAKFVEDSTSSLTLRDVLTRPYAAPEQWRIERPTAETDVYALGCIIHAVLTGRPPFSGNPVELRDQHLNASPPSLKGVPDRIAGFVSQMLRKPPKARPSLARCAQVLAETDWSRAEDKSSGSALARATRHVAEAEAKAEAYELSNQARLRERKTLIDDAIGELKQIRNRLFRRIKDNADATRESGSGDLMLGRAGIEFASRPAAMDAYEIARGQYGRARYDALGWDILAWSKVGVAHGNEDERVAYSWSASLLFADRRDGAGYRWYEVAFFDSAFSPRVRRHQPFALDGHDENLYAAMGKAMHTVGVAYGPIPIDGEDEDRFTDRWVTLFALAATGELRQPNMIPVNLDTFLQVR